MKSIKPGRGPSYMGAIGSLFTAGFGVIWTIAAISMGAPWFFPLFGVFFVVLAIVQGLYHKRNATGRDRMSLFDITDESEEGDPLDPRRREPSKPRGEGGFCPYCGARTEGDWSFCRKCGKSLN